MINNKKTFVTSLSVASAQHFSITYEYNTSNDRSSFFEMVRREELSFIVPSSSLS